MNHQTLDKIVREHEATAVDYQQEGTLLLDRSGQHMTYLAPDSEATHGEEAERFFAEVETQTKALISLQEENGGSKRALELIGVTVNVPLETLASDDLCEGVAHLIKGLSLRQIVDLMVFFQAPPARWPTALDPLLRHLDDLKGKGRIHLTLSGPFARTEDSCKEYLIDHDARLILAHHPHEAGATPDPTALETIYDLADFGFRVLVAWYVHSGNIAAIPYLIDDNMFANYNSGFAVPLISHSPYYHQFEGAFRLPQTREYLELLTDVYRKHPYYDEILFPLSSMATSAYRGGVTSAGDTARSIQLLVLPEGEVRVFGHVPVLAACWTRLAELQAMEQAEIYDHFLDGCRKMRLERLSPRCRGCQWKNLCGGEYTESNLKPFGIHCEVKAFFYRVFLWQRSKAMRVVTEARDKAGAEKEAVSNTEA